MSACRHCPRVTNMCALLINVCAHSVSDTPHAVNREHRYIMRNAGLEETQAGIKIAGRNINNLRYADDTTLMAESE